MKLEEDRFMNHSTVTVKTFDQNYYVQDGRTYRRAGDALHISAEKEKANTE